jgi:hypothetical protein
VAKGRNDEQINGGGGRVWINVTAHPPRRWSRTV